VPGSDNQMLKGTKHFESAELGTIGNTLNGGSAYKGQPFGCYDADDNDPSSSSIFVYYHVLIER
jgi:hypothetical protein